MSLAGSSSRKTYGLLLLGDLMLGRLVDALLPTSIAREAPTSDPESAAQIVDNQLLARHPELKHYSYLSPWGNSVDLVKNADAVLGNLETALTTSERKWKDKVFNYRSHPDNVKCLTGVGMGDGKKRGYLSLANNHTLDWEVAGLVETVKTLEGAGIEFAGAGRTRDEASKPATLRLGEEASDGGWQVKCWSFSDHPNDWKDIDSFNLIEYSSEGRKFMKDQILAKDTGKGTHPDDNQKLDLKIVSMHWGPNYRWRPAEEIIKLAHWLVDECDIDIIHGHSSHHIQGVEIYKGKLIVYGCGDFVDDYAVDSSWRNDLSAAWRVTIGEKGSFEGQKQRLEVLKLEVFPNRIQRFQARILKPEDEDHQWLERKFRLLCEGFGTKVEKDLGEDGQIVVNIRKED